MSEFNCTKERTSRKLRVCESCRQAIKPGMLYVYSAGKENGYFYTFCQHSDCRAFEIQANEAAGGLYFDEYVWLHELVADSGTSILSDAPNAVRYRFQ